MMTHGTTTEKQDLAEDILFEVWQNAVSLSDNPQTFEAIKKAVKDILNRIKDFRDVNILSVEKSCIILEFGCSSCNGLLELLDFLESVLFANSIQSLNQALSEYCEDIISVTAFITIDSILKTMGSLYVQDQERISSGIRLKMECSSVDAIQNLQQYFNTEETTCNVNQIEQSLSEIVGDNISIVASLDTRGFEDMFNEKEFDIYSTPQWTSDVLPPEEKYKSQNIINSTSQRRVKEDIKEAENSISNILYRSTSMPTLPFLAVLEDFDSINERSELFLSHSFPSFEREQITSRRETIRFRQISRLLDSSNSCGELRDGLRSKSLSSECIRARGTGSSNASIHSRSSSLTSTGSWDSFMYSRSSCSERAKSGASNNSIGSRLSNRSWA